ncbi:MAG: DEAD/DEAH box helicase, partial [Clostridiales bacterium]|nr:DEAD/DEAH box helicase [Clostridiales bacterium]
SSNIEELNTRLKGIVIRRIKKEVLSELPEKQKTNIELKIDNVSEYAQAEQDIIDYINDKKGYSAADKASRAKALVKIETLKQIAAEGKLPGVYEWIDSFLASGEKLVIFAWHDFVINALRAKYSSISVSLTGSNSSEQRQASVDAFQNNPSIKLFIANIQAGGLGITLTASSNVAFVELGWTPSIMTQAEDRVHRIGQKNAVNVYYLLARNTIDDMMCELLIRKSSVIDAAIDGKAYLEFSMFDELIDSFRKNQ